MNTTNRLDKIRRTHYVPRRDVKKIGDIYFVDSVYTRPTPQSRFFIVTLRSGQEIEFQEIGTSNWLKQSIALPDPSKPLGTPFVVQRSKSGALRDTTIGHIRHHPYFRPIIIDHELKFKISGVGLIKEPSHLSIKRGSIVGTCDDVHGVDVRYFEVIKIVNKTATLQQVGHDFSPCGYIPDTKIKIGSYFQGRVLNDRIKISSNSWANIYLGNPLDLWSID